MGMGRTAARIPILIVVVLYIQPVCVHTQAKDAAEAQATYAKAKEALVAYLKGTKLEPIGDPIYTSQ